MTNLFPHRYYRFKKNLGKTAGLNLGFQKARGDYIITMDTFPKNYKGYDLGFCMGVRVAGQIVDYVLESSR